MQFIDKPLAASLALRIVQLSKETGAPFFRCSSYRFLLVHEKLAE
jgi:hypothetical protein